MTDDPAAILCLTDDSLGIWSFGGLLLSLGVVCPNDECSNFKGILTFTRADKFIESGKEGRSKEYHCPVCGYVRQYAAFIKPLSTPAVDDFPLR